MKYKGPLLGFHLIYFCLGYLTEGLGKNIKYASAERTNSFDRNTSHSLPR